MTARCANVFTANRSCRQPSCCCRNACRATLPWRAPPALRDSTLVKVGTTVPPMQRRYQSPHSRLPHTHLLSNGRYAVMLTNAGSGYSHWRDLAVTRWREDVTRDCWGSYIFLKDIAQRRSCGRQDISRPAPSRTAMTSPSPRTGPNSCAATDGLPRPWKSRYRRKTMARCGASRWSISPTGLRDIEVTSYAEIVLAPEAADLCPSRLQQDVRANGVRRPGRRAARHPPAPIACRAAAMGRSYRRGRGRVRRPRHSLKPTGRGSSAGARESAPRSPCSTAGRYPTPPVRCSTRSSPCASAFTFRRAPTVRIAFWTLVAPSRDEALALVEKHSNAAAFERAADAGLDPGAGPASSPRHHSRRSASVPAPGQSRDLCRRRPCARPPTC